jgi:hypothetical protein
MNSSLQKALLISMLAVGGAVSALGQYPNVTSGGYNWDDNCIDPTNVHPYSTNFLTFQLADAMWMAGVGVQGTASYTAACNPAGTNTISVNVDGRVGFANGPFGSIQDDYRIANGDPNVNMDNGATFNYAMNSITDPVYGFVWFPPGSNNVGLQATSVPYTFTYDNIGWDLPAPGQEQACTSGSGWSFFDITTASSATTQTSLMKQVAFGGTPISYWEGVSNRYARVEYLLNGVDALLYVDLLGDTSRFYWQLTNTGGASYIGLFYSQWPYITSGYSGNNYGNFQGNTQPIGGQPIPQTWTTREGVDQVYITLPGQAPVRLEERLTRQSNPSSFPSYFNITGALNPEFNPDATTEQLNPLTGPGYQVVLGPTPDVSNSQGQSDITPVDEIEFGDAVNMTAGLAANVNNPQVRDILIPDTEPGFDLVWTEKWYPALVQPGATRTIISYYRSIWGDSDYSDGYAAVVDTPKEFSVYSGSPTSLEPTDVNGNPTTSPIDFDYPINDTGKVLPLQVNIDNTGPFGIATQETPMTNVQVTLQLPQGLSDASGNTRITNYISAIQPREVGSTTFYITADPHMQGPLQYTVTITPSLGATKQITGYINLGATANLRINQGANLVTIPYNLNNPSWEAALGLTQNTDFEAFNWDPTAQEYEPSTGPIRGQGTWIVAANNQGYIALNGNPTTPTDEIPPATGLANPVVLQPGWNLIANPYNYPIPLGQLQGVPLHTSNVYTYDEMLANSVIEGSLAYYDPTQQQYTYIGADTDQLLPNYGYWVYSTQAVAIEFPPIYNLFIRAADQKPPFKQRYNNWRFQMSTVQGSVSDANDYVGFTTNTQNATLRVRKAPSAPYSGAVRSFVTDTGQQIGEGSGQKRGDPGQYATIMHTGYGRQTYNYNVYTAAAGATTLSWPNLAQLPDNLAVSIKDTVTGQTINPRSVNGYSFLSKAQTTRTFTVSITPLGTTRESVSNVTTIVRTVGNTKAMPISFTAGVRGGATLTVYQGSKLVGTVVNDMNINAGLNSVTWDMVLSNGRLAGSGHYTLSIQATGEGGDTATKLVNFNL